ncbi:MAG TPA: hypothetical protein VF773_18400 [Verrucomicrobiae bacterium]
MKLLLAAVFLALFVGCSKQENAAPTEGSSHAEATADLPGIDARTNRLSRKEFFARIYVPAYEQVGKKDPRWDEAAKAYLNILAAEAGEEEHNHDAEHEKVIQAAREKVIASGCKDPLVRYMILRQTRDPWRAHEEGTNDWVQVAHELDGSGYHQYWKFFSYKRAAQALKSGSPRTNSPAVVHYRSETSTRLVQLVKDYTLPASVMYEAVNSWINEDLSSAKNLREWTYQQIEPAMMQGWGDRVEPHIIRGAFNIKYAWDARGGGWASTVPEDGWEKMRERLGIARRSLSAAWAIEPQETIARQMLSVELGDSQGRPAMEMWFNRAMQVNPASYEACEAKLYWLMPKWHGSREDVIAFGRECLTNKNGNVPLILQEGHRQLATWHEQSGKGKKDDYWKLPGVWEDCKASFEAFFANNPDGIGWRHNYALAAYKCEKWNDLRKQIKLLGPVNYSYFGGKEAFDEMVRKAEEMGRE